MAVLRTVVKVKAWTYGTKGEPYYPDDFEITRSDILQWTDVMSNHNKYYSIEQHLAEEKYDFDDFVSEHCHHHRYVIVR